MVRACITHREALLERDPWLPYPQNSCCFRFGERQAPLPIGALFHLWDRVPEFTTPCPACGGRLIAYGFSGLLAIGGFHGICINCETDARRRFGGMPALWQLVGPYLEDTPWFISGASLGGCHPGERGPLYLALRRLNAESLPDESWVFGQDRPAVSLRVGR